MLERKILSFFFSCLFFCQLIELFHRTLKKKKKKIELDVNYSYLNPLPWVCQKWSKLVAGANVTMYVGATF